MAMLVYRRVRCFFVLQTPILGQKNIIKSTLGMILPGFCDESHVPDMNITSKQVDKNLTSEALLRLMYSTPP